MSSLRVDPRVNENVISIQAGDPPIKVLVGPEKTPFYVHEKVLRKPKMLFDSALKKEWNPGQDRIMELPVDNPQAFALYVEWLYNGKIACKTKEDDRNFDLLIELYLLGNKLLDTQFQDRAMDAMVAATHDLLPEPSDSGRNACRAFPTNLESVDRIWKNTTSDAPIRQWIINMFVLFGDGEWDLNKLENPSAVHQGFLLDLAKALMDKREVRENLHEEMSKLDSDPGCAYHCHGEDEPCESKTTPAMVRRAMRAQRG